MGNEKNEINLGGGITIKSTDVENNELVKAMKNERKGFIEEVGHKEEKNKAEIDKILDTWGTQKEKLRTEENGDSDFIIKEFLYDPRAGKDYVKLENESGEEKEISCDDLCMLNYDKTKDQKQFIKEKKKSEEEVPGKKEISIKEQPEEIEKLLSQLQDPKTEKKEIKQEEISTNDMPGMEDMVDRVIEEKGGGKYVEKEKTGKEKRKSALAVKNKDTEIERIKPEKKTINIETEKEEIKELIRKYQRIQTVIEHEKNLSEAKANQNEIDAAKLKINELKNSLKESYLEFTEKNLGNLTPEEKLFIQKIGESIEQQDYSREFNVFEKKETEEKKQPKEDSEKLEDGTKKTIEAHQKAEALKKETEEKETENEKISAKHMPGMENMVDETIEKMKETAKKTEEKKETEQQITEAHRQAEMLKKITDKRIEKEKTPEDLGIEKVPMREAVKELNEAEKSLGIVTEKIEELERKNRGLRTKSKRELTPAEKEIIKEMEDLELTRMILIGSSAVTNYVEGLKERTEIAEKGSELERLLNDYYSINALSKSVDIMAKGLELKIQRSGKSVEKIRAANKLSGSFRKAIGNMMLSSAKESADSKITEEEKTRFLGNIRNIFRKKENIDKKEKAEKKQTEKLQKKIEKKLKDLKKDETKYKEFGRKIDELSKDFTITDFEKICYELGVKKEGIKNLDPKDVLKKIKDIYEKINK